MDDPTKRISSVIKTLTQGTSTNQEKALNDYFLPDSYFTHPFCRVPSFERRQVPFTPWTVDSRWLVLMIYRWYHILSPEIKLQIDSIAFDKPKNLLYVTIHQTFTLWFVPFSLWQANVKLVSVLELAHLPVDEHKKPLLANQPDDHALAPKQLYFVKGQEDHYEVEEFLKFIAPWGASLLWRAWQLFATIVCVVGVAILWPILALRGQLIATRTGEDTRAVNKH